MTLGDNLGLFNQSLDEMRTSVRNAAYPNSEAETKAVTEVEQRIDDKVQLHEESLINIANATLVDSDGAIARADAIRGELNDLQTAIERNGASVELAKRYEGIRKRMELQLKQLRRVQREAEFHAEKVTDAYGSLDTIRRRYPAVVAGRSF